MVNYFFFAYKHVTVTNADFSWMHFISRASALSIRVCGFRYLALKLVPIKRFISRTL